VHSLIILAGILSVNCLFDCHRRFLVRAHLIFVIIITFVPSFELPSLHFVQYFVQIWAKSALRYLQFDIIKHGTN